MKSQVYFYDIHKHHKISPVNKLGDLAARLDVSELLSEGGNCAVKVHFGEPGNASFIRPIYIKKIVSIIKGLKLNPFLTDTNTLYYGQRSNAVDHLNAAIGNGFAYAVVDAPLIIGDGLNGKDYVNVPVNGKHFSEVKIGSAIYHADAMVVVSHFKGHELSGFGGAIKNISMGCASRAGKQMMHSAVKPKVNGSICTSCGKCIQYCPTNAIEIIQENKPFASVNSDVCYGCGECVVTCPAKAIKPNWQTETSVMQEKMAEFAAGAVQNKKNKVIYFNFLIDMSPCCDCYHFNDAPIKENIGILASNDPVAIDRASLDLVGLDVFKKIYPEINPAVQLNYLEQLGIGTQEYDLINV
ncbi:MAG: 4Fe-4S ferredoxin [Candidatus Margulisiibacteriota bacterium]|nr:MAG: 4Fe-4S ferredoxin [Candidatus Margulisbacteria bacterium GWD2_39_127]OGI00985.1 MAG: 4Fe-4S ferredoxin [Candidatus Margulisbacteria bacterium GWF2_38_17]OGI08042.1 MAG: 4Fe-4S ferredoxin [Candidatus Margulisbacteria bacterium GWE2_39_32]PZM82096.1 MAG: 4Fe-4S ferredoxin [Candidatus Margulisiibacteriota bacterium]HAR62874.1 4Fe-4S ferredoxin [Candidatus Margulisiibacteriota bacterium]